MVEIFDRTIEKLVRRIESRLAEPDREPPVFNVLALSGGGDYGAFGAGFLVGWGSVTDPQWRRPDFDIVTGVSTGALLAPFAFVGTDEAYRVVESFYRNPRKDWVRSGGPLFFLPTNPSFMTIPGLDRDVRTVIDAQFVARMAEQSKLGKGLVVSATDLDFGRQRFWEVGFEAELAAESGDLDRVHRILLASAAIPAVFPAIAIDDSLYADGGVSANVFLRLEHRNPNSLVARWFAAHPGEPLPKFRYWIVINNQTEHRPSVVQPRWPGVVGPSLEVAVRAATLAQVRWLATEAVLVNTVYGAEIEVLVVSIPNDWTPPLPGDFRKETMESLSDLGRALGADPSSWMVWADGSPLRRPDGVPAPRSTD